MSARLDQLLAQMYRAKVLGEVPIERVVDLAQREMAQSEDLRREVRDKTRELESTVSRRRGSVFVEERQLEFLQLMVGNG